MVRLGSDGQTKRRWKGKWAQDWLVFFRGNSIGSDMTNASRPAPKEGEELCIAMCTEVSLIGFSLNK